MKLIKFLIECGYGCNNGWGECLPHPNPQQQVDKCGIFCDVDTTMGGIALRTFNWLDASTQTLKVRLIYD